MNGRLNESSYSLLSLFCLSLLSVSCLEKVPEVSKTLEIPELGIVLNYEGWTYEEQDPSLDPVESSKSKTRKPETQKNANVLFYLFENEPTEHPEIRTVIHFVSEPIPNRNAKVALEDYVASIGAIYSNLYKGYEVLSVPQRRDLGNNKAMFVESKFQLPKSGKDREVRMFQWIVLKDQTAYIFTATTPESEQSKKSKKILNTMSSITESKPDPKK
ncbi:LIC_13215 family putative lipoprotein [Leptospira wolffii]|uniref:Lipoprotein n=1 Tax=Leptospira wolffii TaxID=409998 RepID=A0A2M9ZFF0_9LEPT|nr:lipoprotein [Leptospira wolffii]EPG64839.1 putative lipoprotein [Leptospira wolffii serovar Khorat str. Khorat-H2]PJZ67125.1 hypothetical protein CH371_03380 [Leptospira wolffii]